MGVHIFANAADTTAVLYCSTSMWAFGPVIEECGAIGADRVASLFLSFLGRDAREFSQPDLERKWAEFCRALADGARQCEDRPTVGPCEDDDEEHHEDCGNCRWCGATLPPPSAKPTQEPAHEPR